MPSVAETIAARIRGLRAARGWSLEKLAEQAGLSRDAVVRIEGGSRNPRLGTTEALASALGVSLADVIGAPEVSSDPRIETIRAHLAQVEPELADRVVAAVVGFCSGAGRTARARKAPRATRSRAS